MSCIQRVDYVQIHTDIFTPDIIVASYHFQIAIEWVAMELVNGITTKWRRAKHRKKMCKKWIRIDTVFSCLEAECFMIVILSCVEAVCMCVSNTMAHNRVCVMWQCQHMTDFSTVWKINSIAFISNFTFCFCFERLQLIEEMMKIWPRYSG